jgi:hypothetical protein
VRIGLATLLWGAAGAAYYAQLGLTLSHYDARAHLVVARRIFDSITPGWQQIGAVWLPLPHVLNAIPVQVDAFYRSGASGVAVSVLSFALATASIGAIAMSVTGSAAAALAAGAVFALNPNVLYLQATPMTEPLTLGLVTLAVAMLLRWVALDPSGQPDARHPVTAPAAIGTVFALACLTRYEAWPITAAAMTLAIWALWRQGDSWTAAGRRVRPIIVSVVTAIAAFMVLSRVVVGEWFVSGGFFVPENVARNDPVAAARQVLWGVQTLSGTVLTTVAAIGVLGIVMRSLRRPHAHNLVALALTAAAALPWLAFVEGHPFRIRYMTMLLAGEAVAAATIVALSRRASAVLALVLVAAVVVERPPIDRRAPLVVEAQWDRANVVARQPVGDHLRQSYGGETIMASMGSLGHYMQELSGVGLDLRDFLHEGNGDIWLQALESPRPFVGWILIEERAEGGDMLARLVRERPSFLDGFERISEGAGLALYARQNAIVTVAR